MLMQSESDAYEIFIGCLCNSDFISIRFSPKKNKYTKYTISPKGKIAVLSQHR